MGSSEKKSLKFWVPHQPLKWLSYPLLTAKSPPERWSNTSISFPRGQVTMAVTALDGPFHRQDCGGSEVTASFSHTTAEQGFNPSSLGLPMAWDLKGEGIYLHISHAMSKSASRPRDWMQLMTHESSPEGQGTSPATGHGEPSATDLEHAAFCR